MEDNNLTPAQYFKLYRDLLGFSNQADTKAFLTAKNIFPKIDFDYMGQLNTRLDEIIQKLNKAVHESYQLKQAELEVFLRDKLYETYVKIQKNSLLPRLNNQGRRPEKVCFSWLRGFVMMEYFTPALAKIFQCKLEDIKFVGDDDISSLETFKRTPTADIEISSKYHGKLRVEVQAGFQGINDIKEHKVREAQKVARQKNKKTICVHFDLFNGQVAFVPLDKIKENDLNWITRQQMEGQSVFAIDQNYFKWRLLDSIPAIKNLELF